MPGKGHISIAHSPDTDDIFMFYALKTGKINDPDFDFDFVSADIETLNRLALTEKYDITALSMHAWAHASDKYAILSSGASLAEKDWGPSVVAKKQIPLASLAGKKIAIPGEWTTASLVLRMMLPEFVPVVMKPEEILPAVKNGLVEAGLLIHEGQILYRDFGLNIITRLIDYWRGLAGGLPLPLGISAVKKSLGAKVMQRLSALQKKSILYALQHFEDAKKYLMGVNPVLSEKDVDRYLSWYVNQRTVDLGESGREAMELLFQMALEKKMISKAVKIEIV